jgi:hypothetical protein
VGGGGGGGGRERYINSAKVFGRGECVLPLLS